MRWSGGEPHRRSGRPRCNRAVLASSDSTLLSVINRPFVGTALHHQAVRGGGKSVVCHGLADEHIDKLRKGQHRLNRCRRRCGIEREGHISDLRKGRPIVFSNQVQHVGTVRQRISKDQFQVIGVESEPALVVQACGGGNV